MGEKHTAGPWEAFKVPYQSSAYYILGRGKDKRSQAVAHIPRSTIQPMEANARLIAAALDLHNALVEIASFNDDPASRHLERTGSYCFFDEPGSVQIARAALAKAGTP